MVEAAQITRYERVKQILDRAAKGATADYDGHPEFWKLPLPEFLDVEIYGIRMIAPAPPEAEPSASSCCHAATGKAPAIKRSAQSGLIKGLRGAAPFDGNQYPRLMWGGKIVSQDDISFIAEWIDDGCPDKDRQISFPVEGTIKTSKETVEATNVEDAARTFDIYDGSTSEYANTRGELKQRMNLDCMSATEIDKLQWAFRQLYNLNKWPEDRRSYNNMALIHQNHCQHGWERFLPWHRIYLYEFEQVLQDICPGVTLPYWDFTMPQYCPETPENGEIIPRSFQAYLTDESLIYLEKAHPSLPASAVQALRTGMVDKEKRYTSQSEFFAAVATLTEKKYTVGKHRERFIDALLAANALWYPLRWPAQYNGKTINTAIHYHYPTAADIDQIMSLRTFRDFGGGSYYDDSFGFLDQNPHNTMHIWTGGLNPTPEKDPPAEGYLADLEEDPTKNRNRSVRVAGRRLHTREDLYSQPPNGDMLSNLTASFDPIFWPIHSNIDRLWHEWQHRNPHSLPLDLDAVLTPWSYTIADTLDMARFGYEYVKCAFVIPVGLAAPVGRFVSKPIDIPDTVRTSFQQAEVRLHRVPQLPRSCFIRVFLNLPDANASTSIEDVHYAGYLAIFGHADCIGGPGHCDLPPSQPRKYDQRPRHHNTPRNHRVNVSKTARRLFDEGASSLQITLVVIGADYCEDSDLLRLDSVSLDFLDN
jgi:tyrosinase